MNNYRKCAGVIVFNKNKKVLVCARNDTKGTDWQFPQGGIEAGEQPHLAAMRELKEETSVVSVEFVKGLENPIRYDFPLEVKQKLQKRGIKSDGQEMYWSLLFFYGSDEEINLNTQEKKNIEIIIRKNYNDAKNFLEFINHNTAMFKPHIRCFDNF